MKTGMKKAAIALALASLGGVSSQVSAGALATSVVEFTNFQVFWGVDGTQVDYADFSTLTYAGTADVGASLASTGASGDNGASSNGSPLDLFVSEGTVPGTYNDNDFDQISAAGGLPAGNFAIGDSFEIGSPITSLPNATQDNADLGNGAYVSLENPDLGSATSNNGLTASITFEAPRDDFLVFQFDLATFAEAYLDLGEVADSFAQASWSVTLVLEDITGGTFALDFGLTCDVSRTAPNGSTGIPSNGLGSGDCGASGIGIQVPTANVVAGNVYELTARITTEADAQLARIPEPGVMALMGAGLLSLVGLRRRRSVA